MPVITMLKLYAVAGAPADAARVIVADVDAPAAMVVKVGLHVQVK